MVKYIKDKDNQIIVFSKCISHHNLKRYEPISAGFIMFTVDNGSAICKCYGESVSLQLKSHEQDTYLAMRQILGYQAFDDEVQGMTR